MLASAESRLVKSLREFLTRVAMSSDLEAWSRGLMPQQTANFRDKKCTVAIRLFRYDFAAVSDLFVAIAQVPAPHVSESRGCGRGSPD